MTMNIRLYGIIDPQIGKGRSLAHLARAAVDGGATLIQYRAKGAETRAMVAEARAIVAALAGTDVPLLINDRVDVALASGAQGVHLGREDMHPSDARAILGSKAMIGATVKNRDDLLSLRGQPINYACIGGVFATSHKDNPDPPLGLEGFCALRTEARVLLGDLPVGAIAGISPENAGSLIRAGADGVAVIGALFGGNDPRAAARAMLVAMGEVA
ncbi:MAG: thiamine phosphate synthase [Rhabdaerophilum sp.]